GDGNDPQIDSYSIPVSEQTESHIVIAGISEDGYARLKKNIEQYPGLDLRTGQRRYYPFSESASHVIGTMAPVSDKELLNDPNEDDELRKYWPNDRIGRTGVESLAEQTLRGSRGRIVKIEGKEQPDETCPPTSGKDV